MADTQVPANDFAAQLAALSAQFVVQLGSTLDQLNLKVAGQGPDVSRELLEELHASLHKLAGSGGTFGFPELSVQARALEVTAKGWLDAPGSVSHPAWLAWRDGLLALRQTLNPATDLPGVADVAEIPAAADKGERVRIVLIEDDMGLAEEFSRGLTQFGYEVTHYTDFASAEAAILANPPHALVVDIMLPGHPPVDGTRAFKQMLPKLGRRPPVVFMTARVDFSDRISAARAGGDAFLAKPVSVPRLAEVVEKLLQEREHTPYRVLIVDDDEVLAEHYRLTLAASGMHAEKICHPQEALAVMQTLNPEVLLMDLYMPECTGAELARAIRYEEAWQGMPIVYLSAESDLDQQIEAMGNGADDFLLKPISDARLVASVRARAARARKVAELMHQDSLTGLLRHSSIKDRLTQELDRANRQGTAMAVVMVDIDFFKKVNDSWGHPTGDQVIKTLGHLLRQRLRKQDSIGRYGGEEFLAVLPECPAADAMRLLDDIRQRFGEVSFAHRGESFSVTLSAGIASSEQFHSAADLLAAADAALYEAKHGGRNQVRIAGK
jgi:diguanylate cyclase (GGDEF)-like protein